MCQDCEFKANYPMEDEEGFERAAQAIEEEQQHAREQIVESINRHPEQWDKLPSWVQELLIDDDGRVSE